MSVREINRNDDVYIGLEFPLDHNLTGFFRQSKTIPQQVKSNIKNLLLTSKGERVFQPDFGCDLRDLLFEQINSETLDGVDNSIRIALDTWLPYVNINDLIIVQDESNPNEITITLEYSTTLQPDALDNITFNLVVGE
tara:strand:+ start:300 stop:713 length:414 start_codon:yes stop_codon:yes gene_type:complete